MDTKGDINLSVKSLAGVALPEEGVFYIAIKGSLHANDCSGFGLGQEEVRALTTKFPGSGSNVVNGVTIKTNVLNAINALNQLGYKVASSTGETEITWTLQPLTGDVDRINKILDKAESPLTAVRAPDNSGYTALHYAARNGHYDICQILLDKGAHVDALTKCGNATPLHKAAAAGQLDIVKLLLNKKACVDKQDVDGQTVLHRAVQKNDQHLIDFLLKTYPHLKDIKDNKGRNTMDFLPTSK